jgi:PERQ amino acid-rich with GYF domain-containing protein
LSKYGRRPRQDSDNLPEWASEEPLENRGGSFDSAGKFQASNVGGENRRPTQQQSTNRDENDDDLEDWLGDEASPPSHRRHHSSRENHGDKLVEHADEDEGHFEDEEVDVDDLPSDMKRDTLEQREREKAAAAQSTATTSNASHAEDKDDAGQRHKQDSQSQQQQAEVEDNIGRQADDEQHLVHWIYLDPQGNTQGPFNATDMLDWFNAGYFPQDLMLRRTIDRRFIQLGEMTKRYGRIPFMPGGNAPAPLQDVEPQLPSEQEEKHRIQQQQQQQALLYQQQLQHQLMMNQQLMQQQQLFAIQQQQQGASPAALALAAQQISEQQKQQQQLLSKLMQLQLTLLPQPQQQQLGGVLQPQSKEFSASPSPLDFVSLSSPSPLEMLQQRQQQQHPAVTAPFEMPKQSEPPRQQQQQQGGLDFGAGFGNGSGGGYDPIKSLLSQLHDSVNEFPNQSASSQTSSIFGNSAGSGSSFAGFGGIPQPQQQNSRPGSSHQAPPVSSGEFGEPAGHRSIWDLPVSGLRDEQPSPEPKVC